MKKEVVRHLVLMMSVLIAGCVATLPNQVGGVGATASKSSADSASQTKVDREAAQRSLLSKNHSVVTMRPVCEGLFVPSVGRALLNNVLPVFSMRMLNNSVHRYEVKLDISLKRHTRNLFQNSLGKSTFEKMVTIRAGSYIDVLLEKEVPSPGVTVREVSRVHVLECRKT